MRHGMTRAWWLDRQREERVERRKAKAWLEGMKKEENRGS